MGEGRIGKVFGIVEVKEGGDDGSLGVNIEGEFEIGLGRVVFKVEMRGN